MDLERELRAALRRPEAPPGFAERILERVARGEAVPFRPRPRIDAVRAVAAALTLVVALGALGGYRWEQRRRAERAAEEAILALQIVSEKMNIARRTLVQP